MPGPVTGPASPNVAVALKSAAARTGVEFDYLYRVAARESGFDPAAQAKTSSAAGLFQFIEDTWLGAVKKYGPRHGLAAEAAAIAPAPGGGYEVADPARRTAILGKRLDPEKAAALAGELTRENRAALEKKLGRPARAPELYAAHFLGASGAAKLLAAPKETAAAGLLPAAAKANRPVFYDGARARTVGEVMASFDKTIGAAARAGAPPLASAGRRPAPAAPRPPLRDPAPAYTTTRTPPTAGRLARLEAYTARFSAPEPLALMILEAVDPTSLAETIGGRTLR